MTDQNTTANRGGISLAALLTILFVVLKLTHVIDWPWIWVLAPAWISAGIFVLIVIVVLIIAGAVAAVRK